MARLDKGIFPPDELTAAPCGLLSVATVIEHTDNDERWIAGYSQDTLGAPTVRILSSPNNATVPNALVFDGTGQPLYYDNDPFFFEVEAKRSGMGLAARDPRKDIEDQIEAVTQKVVERELWEGVAAQATGVTNTNTYLRRAANDGGATVLTTTGVHPKKALSLLEGAISNSPTGGGAVIHMTRETASTIVGGGVGYATDDHGEGFLLTSLGTPVVVGSGYTGNGPVGASNAAATGSNRWMYVTGPVTVHLGPAEGINDTLAQGFEPRTNDSIVKAVRPAAVHFDTTIFYAAQVTLPDVP